MFKNIKYGFNCIVNCKFIICISFVIFSSVSQAQNLTQYLFSVSVTVLSFPCNTEYFQVFNAFILEEAKLLATNIFNAEYGGSDSGNTLSDITCQAQ